MPRLLSIEWDQQEARFVVASLGRGKLVVEQAAAIALPQPSGGERLRPEELGEAIRAGLRDHRVSVTAALVAVSRSNIELAQLGLPPTPDEDLPDLVRYQASRELSSFNEGSLLDFVPLTSAVDEPRAVLAASLGREQFTYIQAVCAASGIKPQRLLVRPHAAGSLFYRQMHPREQVSLLVNSLKDETDMAVLVGGRVLLCRTVRLPKPADGESSTAPILAEIRRTIFAVQNQPGGGEVSAVYICGGSGEHRELVQSTQDELSLAAEVFQPFAGLRLSHQLQVALPDDPGRFASLLGMLSDEVHGSHSIDFLHPRKKREPPSRKKMALLAGVAVALVLATGLHYAWGKFSAVDEQIAQLNRRLKQLDQSVRRAKEKEAAVAAIEEWLAGDVVWLDELRDLSLRFPKPRDAVLLRMSLGSKPNGGGAIELEGVVRDPSIVGQMESGLRDDRHEVRTKRVQESVQGQAHTWKFDSTLLVAGGGKEQYQSHLPDTKVAARSAESATANRTAAATRPSSGTMNREQTPPGTRQPPRTRER